MENLERYSKKIDKDSSMSPERAHTTAMLRMIKYKIENKYNIKGTKEIAKLVGYSYRYLSGIFMGRVKVPKRLISTLCYIGGITMEELDNQYTKRELDEYINEKGHLIVDGVDYGKITK